MAASLEPLDSPSELEAVKTCRLSQAFRICVKYFCLRHGVTIFGGMMWATAITLLIVLITYELDIIFSGSP